MRRAQYLAGTGSEIRHSRFPPPRLDRPKTSADPLGASEWLSNGLAVGRGAKRAVTLGLGALWTIDGLLQLQPRMFTQSLAVDVVANALMSLPSPIYFGSLRLLTGFFLPNLVLWNAGIAALQLAIGISLLVGPVAVRRLALATSVVWSMIVWVFGEGLGGVLTGTITGGVFPGTPSVMNGFPGAALIYALVAIFILLPDGRWTLLGRFSTVRDAPALLFLVFSAVQAAPLMWTGYGQASIFASNTDKVPAQLAASMLQPLTAFSIAHPVPSNCLELGACLASAYGLWSGKREGYLFALGWLAFIWVFPLALGGALTGLATDPNTPPAIALLMVPAIVASRHKLPNKIVTQRTIR